MHAGWQNGSLFTLAIVLTILFVVLAKAMMKPLRTSVDLQAFRAENSLFESHPRLGFRPKSRAKVMEHVGSTDVVVRTDDRGARISVKGTAHSPHRRILGVGCSQTWGFGVQNEDTFLAKVGSALDLAVDNFAVSGFGGTGAFLQVEEHLMLQPEVVIYGLWEDHINRNVTQCLEDASPVCVERPYLAVEEDQTFHMRMPTSNVENLDLLRRYYLETSEHTDQYRSFASDVRWVAYDLWAKGKILISKLSTRQMSHTQKIQGMQYILKNMNRAVDSYGGQLVVVWIPLYFSTEIHAPPDEFVVLSQQEGFLLVDMSGPFQDMIEQGRPIALPTDGHMNPDAHAEIAKAITKLLEERLPLIAAS